MDEQTQLQLRRRIRGRLRTAVRTTITEPLRRRVPLDVLESVIAVHTRVSPNAYTDANPFALRTVDPDCIQRSVLESAPRYPQWGRVVGGSWDDRWESFERRAVPKAIRQRYRENRPWEETSLVDAFRDQLARFGTAWGYTSMDGFDARCVEIDRLYESMREGGYRRQEALHGTDRRGPTALRLDEICVDVGRDGRFYWRGYGQHRLAIAKLLSIEQVPVLVHRRHRQWQDVRDSVRHAPIEDRERRGKAHRNHPDLQDLFGARRSR